jgi:hypothetical protein
VPSCKSCALHLCALCVGYYLIHIRFGPSFTFVVLRPYLHEITDMLLCGFALCRLLLAMSVLTLLLLLCFGTMVPIGTIDARPCHLASCVCCWLLLCLGFLLYPICFVFDSIMRPSCWLVEILVVCWYLARFVICDGLLPGFFLSSVVGASPFA